MMEEERAGPSLVGLCVHAITAATNWLKHWQPIATNAGPMITTHASSAATAASSGSACRRFQREAALFGMLPSELRANILSQLLRKSLLDYLSIAYFIQPNVVSLKLSGGGSTITDYTISRITTTCTNLTSLSLYSLSNVSPNALVNLLQGVGPRLLSINLSKCPAATTDVIRGLALHCTNLESLIMNRSGFVCDAILTETLPRWPSLCELSLLSCSISSTAIEQLANTNTSLTSLNISRCTKITKVGPVVSLIDRCRRLTCLRMSNLRHLDDSILRAIATYIFSTIQVLDLSCCERLSEIGLVALLQACPDLRTIHLPKSTDEIVGTLSDCCPKLEELYLCKSAPISPEVIAMLAKQCTQLRVFWASKSFGITDFSLAKLLKHGTHLQELYVSGPNLTDWALTSYRGRKLALTLFESSSAELVTDSSIEEMALFCPEMKELNVSGCNLLTNLGLNYLCTGFPLLRSLNLASINVRDEHVLLLADSPCAQHLQYLVLSNCPVSHKYLPDLLQKMPNLYSLNLFQCNSIGGSALLSEKESGDIPQISAEGDERNAKGTVLQEQRLVLPPPEYSTLLSFSTVAFSCLNSINFGNCSNLTMDILFFTLTLCPRLQVLRLSSCSALQDVNFKTCAFPNLSNVVANSRQVGADMASTEALSFADGGLLHLIGTMLPTLHTLDVSFLGSCVTDVGLVKLARSCTRLESLNVSNCPLITDASVKVLFEECQLLQVLHLSQCTSITDATISILEAAGLGAALTEEEKQKETQPHVLVPFLQIISLTDTRVSGEGVEWLQGQRPHLQIHFLQAKKKKAIKGQGKAEWERRKREMEAELEQTKMFNSWNYWRLFPSLQTEDEEEDEAKQKGT